MTSDAKIGLLLGLVFIFIIAFVINGLPRFQNSADNNAQAAEESIVQPEPLGYSVRNSEFRDEQDFQSNINIPTENEERRTGFASNSNPWANDHAATDDNRVAPYYDNGYANQVSELNRVFSPLPEDNSISNVNENEDASIVADSSQAIERLRLDLTTVVAASREVALDGSNNRTDNNAGGRAPNSFGGNGFQGMNGGFRQGGGRGQWGQPGAGQGGFGQGGFAPGQQPNQIRPNTPSREESVTPAAPITQGNPSITASQQNRIIPPVQTAQRTQSGQAFQQKTYVIQEGDNNLAKISKKFYGEQEGNRLVNINRIYEANKDTLKSPDKIFVGQKIVIPQPAAPVEPQPSNVISGGALRNVSSIGPAVINRTNSNSRTETGRWYVVKEDDSLWKISAEQLGNGSRFEEISKLNTDVLNDKNKLKPGMKLRLPAK